MYENFSDGRLAVNNSFGMASHLNSIQMTTNKSLPPDRFLKACPIKYECRNLFVYLIEMEYTPIDQTVATILQYPDKRDKKNFADDKKLNDFVENVKKFAFPYAKTLAESSNSRKNRDSVSSFGSSSSSLVQFYTFAFTDENRIRQYGFCRSAQSGNHILCIVSYLPWYNVFINILNKISTIINERETTSLYHFLEALYEYELPDPGNYAQIFSHDGIDEIRFQCPDRRVVPSIHENRNLQKFFAFFDLDKLIKIFTALLLERSILVVSKDLENLTSCGLSLEYLIYPLEWLHTFVPIMPEHIDLHVFNQPFPFIYGIHTCIYEKIQKSQLDSNVIILLVDERQILNANKDHLPKNITNHLRDKLKFFVQNDSDSLRNGGSTSNHMSLLGSGSIKAFQEAVLTIIDDYREYLIFDESLNEFKLNEVYYFQIKDVYDSNVDADANGNMNSKYAANENEFYHEFRVTQAFEEFCRDRSDYLMHEKQYSKSMSLNSENSLTVSSSLSSSGINKQFEKDFIEYLFDQHKEEYPKIQKLLDKGIKQLYNFTKKAKQKLNQNRILNPNNYNLQTNSNSSKKERKSSLKPKDSDENIKSSKKNKTNAISNQATDIINMKLKTVLDKYSNKTAISNEKRSARTHLDFYTNEECTDEDNNTENGEGSISSSSSSSSSYQNDESIKEKIRQAAEATNALSNSRISASNLKRITIDLSNDPDIRKYFDSNLNDDEENDEDLEKTLNITESKTTSLVTEDIGQFPLIDIYDDVPQDVITNEIQSPQNVINSQTSKITSIKEDLASIFDSEPLEKQQTNAFVDLNENPFSKDRFIDQIPANPIQNNQNDSEVKNYTKSNINDLIKNFNTLNTNTTVSSSKPINSILNPTIIPNEVKPKTETTYQSIIDEFDPISEENKTTIPNNLRAPYFPNNFANLTARPFQTAAAINQQQQRSPQKPNYNVNLPLVNHTMSNNFPMSHSFSNPTNVTTASASPYYALNYQNRVQTYRPVNFAPTNLNSRLPAKSNSTSFTNFNQAPK